MITEDQLSELFAATAAEIHVPADGAARIQALVAALPVQPPQTAATSAPAKTPAAAESARPARPTAPVRRHRTPPAWVSVAAAVAGLIALGVAVGIRLPHSTARASSSAATAEGQDAVSGPDSTRLTPSSVAGSTPTTSSLSSNGAAGGPTTRSPALSAAGATGGGSVLDVAHFATVTIAVPPAAVGSTVRGLEQLARTAGGSATAASPPVSAPATAEPATSEPRLVVLRVPSTQFGAVNATLSAGHYGQVVSFTATTTDVAVRAQILAGQLADLQTRRSAILGILASSASSPTLLSAQKQLASLDLQLTQGQAATAQLVNDVTEATVTVSVAELPTSTSAP